MKQEYLIELVNCSTEDSIMLQVNETDTSVKAMKSWIMQQETMQPRKKHHLHIIGNKTCDLELEDVYTLCKIIQAVVAEPLSWDIIERVLSEKDSNLVASLLLY